MTEGAALTEAAARLAAAGIEEPRREARLLLGLALKRGVESLLLSADRPLAGNDAARFAALIARRVRHEPYARIAGKREFWSHEFLLSPDTLDPRPDSETLIEAALTLIPDRAAPLEILDFGTGSGALLLALLAELPNASGLGIDIAPGAVATARRNAAALGLAARARFVGGNWGQGVTEPADVILANPPYIPSAELSSLAPEIVDFDPRLALDGGADGLRAYREMAPDLARLLKKSGIALCEIGAAQSAAIIEIMSRAGLELVAKRCDLVGWERCLVFATRTG
ncbi:MAG TPA: peptide chain release factor N(5)-glutamine methyltransferase [Stellaceae bacterium]